MVVKLVFDLQKMSKKSKMFKNVFLEQEELLLERYLVDCRCGVLNQIYILN